MEEQEASSEIVEDLTDQIEVVFHPNPNDEEFDPLSIGDEEMMELEEEAKRSLELARQAEEEAEEAAATKAAEEAAAAKEPQPSTSRGLRNDANRFPASKPPFIDHIFKVPRRRSTSATGQQRKKFKSKSRSKSAGHKRRERDSDNIVRLEHYKFISPDKPKYMPEQKSEGFSILEYEAQLAAEEAAAEEEKARKKQEAEDAEWEDVLIYVDLDEIPSIQELFAVEPDDFLACQNQRARNRPKKAKPMHSEIELKFYNLEEKNPILQFGRRFYTGVFEEPVGSSLFFREKTDEEEPPSVRYAQCGIRRLTSELTPPPDPVFGINMKVEKEWEMVANVQKILKFTRRNAIPKPDSPEGFEEAAGSVSEANKNKPTIPSTIPKAPTREAALAYEFKPKRELKMDVTREISTRPTTGRRKFQPTDPLSLTDSDETSEAEIEEFDDAGDEEEDEDEIEEQLNSSADAPVTVKTEPDHA